MSQGTKILILTVLIAVLGIASYKVFLSKPDAPATASTAGDDPLAHCANGIVECPNTYCLKLEREGWRPMHVPGHPDTDIWMTFVDAQGRKFTVNQNHIGHTIEPVNGTYADTGICPVCKGRTRVCR